MKSVFVLALALSAVLAASALPAGPTKYTTRYDNIDLEEILKSERLLNNYFNCLMDKGKCTPDGSELKRLLPDALETACSKCSDKQRKGSERVLRFLIDKRPTQYAQLEKKYDPTGSYRKKYEDEARKRGIKI